MPSRVLGMKTPYEMIYGRNEFIVPPKVLDLCSLFKPQTFSGKLDPQAVKCVFIGYPPWIRRLEVLESY
jgi:hypothetical protein